MVSNKILFITRFSVNLLSNLFENNKFEVYKSKFYNQIVKNSKIDLIFYVKANLLSIMAFLFE